MPTVGVARKLVAIGAVALVAAVVESVVVGTVQPEGAFWTVPMAALFCAGALCFRRQPDQLAARRYLLAGTAAITWMAGGLGLGIAHHLLGSGLWLVAPNAAMVFLDIAMPTAILSLATVYPDGRSQRRYERWIARTTWVLALAVPLLLLTRTTLHPMLAFGWLADYTGPAPVVSSPLHVGVLHFLDAPATFYARSSIGVLIGLAVILLLARYRRFDEEQRLRTRWPLVAATLAALQPLGNGLASWGVLPQAAVDAPVIIAITSFAVALAIGLLNPRLFDLGRVVRRSLAYIALWVGIGAIYVGVAAAAGIASAGEGLQMAVAVAIAVTLLAEPARRSVARRAARWAYGERASGAELLRRLGDALEHTLEPGELARTLAETIREGLQVDWVRLLMDGQAPVVVGTGAPPDPSAQAGACAPLAYGSERLGTLQCAWSGKPVDRVVLGNLARQTALAMGNARLASEARERALELAASRTRIVEAQETARRRLERDIHDGVQQELVALIAKIGLSRSRLEHNPAALAATLADLQSEVRQVLADLRELASGIHPSVLGDRGIVEAIEDRASRLPLGVTIECPPELRCTRFPEAIEGAAYFVVCEGFANALKHSGAERVTVRLRAEEETLAIEISDNGRGFDSCAPGEPGPEKVTPDPGPEKVTPDGTGLSGLADRVDALGGRFEVRSTPSEGTTLTARLPAGGRRSQPALPEEPHAMPGEPAQVGPPKQPQATPAKQAQAPPAKLTHTVPARQPETVPAERSGG